MGIKIKKTLEPGFAEQFFEAINKTSMKRKNFDTFSKAYAERDVVLSLWNGSELVGFGTMLTDWHQVAIIFDVVVTEPFKSKGYGKRIMDELMTCAPGCRFFLTSTFGHEGFYKKLGFKNHKTSYALYPTDSPYLEEIEL